jgi:hypothetical protein
LESSPISRLKTTWNLLAEKYRTRLRTIGELLSSAKNYSRYREHLAKVRSSRHTCLPYLGLFLRDLTFIHEGNATFVNELINYSKFRLVGTVILELLYYQHKMPKLSRDATTEHFDQLPDTITDMEALYQLSLQIEPRTSNVDTSCVTAIADMSYENLMALDPVLLTRGQLEQAVRALQRTCLELHNQTAAAPQSSPSPLAHSAPQELGPRS